MLWNLIGQLADTPTNHVYIDYSCYGSLHSQAIKCCMSPCVDIRGYVTGIGNLQLAQANCVAASLNHTHHECALQGHC